MIAINLLTNKEYKVLIGREVDVNFNDELLIDFDDSNWYVLSEFNRKSVEKGHEYLTYNINGKLYQGFFTHKYCELKTIHIAIERIKNEFPYIPDKFLRVSKSISGRDQIEFESNGITITISVFYQYNFKLMEELKTSEARLKVYGYSFMKNISGHSGSCSLDDIIENLRNDLVLMKIKPEDKQLSIFDL